MSEVERVIFCGTSSFAAPSLQELLVSDIKVDLVITQPDRPKGRNRNVKPGIVKQIAIENDIQVFQPININSSDSIEIIKSKEPQLIVTVSYGGFLKTEVRSLPKFGCINLHPSLLPKYRGSSPINYTLFDGCKLTGNSIFFLADKMDSGPIAFQSTIEITEPDCYTSLSDKLARMGANNLVTTVKNLHENKPKIQNHKNASFTKKITKQDMVLNFNDYTDNILNRIRGLALKPGVYTYFKQKKLKILLAKKTEKKTTNVPGIVNAILKKEGFTVSCIDFDILIEKVQPEGKKMMSAYDFTLGYRDLIGTKLG